MIANDRKFRYRFATARKLILFKHILLSSILVNSRVIVIENGQKNFQLQLLTFKNSQLQLQQNRVISYIFVNYNYNFSKPGTDTIKYRPTSSDLWFTQFFSDFIKTLKRSEFVFLQKS